MLFPLYDVSFLLGSSVVILVVWYVLRGNVLPPAPVSPLSLILPCTLGESCITSRILKASF